MPGVMSEPIERIAKLRERATAAKEFL